MRTTYQEQFITPLRRPSENGSTKNRPSEAERLQQCQSLVESVQRLAAEARTSPALEQLLQMVVNEVLQILSSIPTEKLRDTTVTELRRVADAHSCILLQHFSQELDSMQTITERNLLMYEAGSSGFELLQTIQAIKLYTVGAQQGTIINLTPSQTGIFYHLMTAYEEGTSANVISKNELYELLNSQVAHDAINNVEVTVHRLRQKFEQHLNGLVGISECLVPMVITARGKGYYFQPQIIRESDISDAELAHHPDANNPKKNTRLMLAFKKACGLPLYGTRR